MKTFGEFLLIEKKDHLIKKLKNLTKDQKDEIIQKFDQRRDLENKIDWNNKKLSYADFSEILSTVSKRGEMKRAKKAVKERGIKGLKEGKDYVEIDVQGDWVGYIPLNHKASSIIASDKIGNCEGKWCVASPGVTDHWNRYGHHGINFIYLISPNGEKYALAVFPPPTADLQDWMDIEDYINETHKFAGELDTLKIIQLSNSDDRLLQIFDQNDNIVEKIKGLDYKKIFTSAVNNTLKKIGNVKGAGPDYGVMVDGTVLTQNNWNSFINRLENGHIPDNVWKIEGFPDSSEKIFHKKKQALRLIHIERNDKLTELPPFPPNITAVILISSPNLKKLSNLPPKLKFLSLDHTPINPIPPIPKTAQILDFSNMKLDSLNIGPEYKNLKFLQIGSDNIGDLHSFKTLPKLPDSLTHLSLYNTGITKLPEDLPKPLKILNLDSDFSNEEIERVKEKYPSIKITHTKPSTFLLFKPGVT